MYTQSGCVWHANCVTINCLQCFLNVYHYLYDIKHPLCSPRKPWMSYTHLTSRLYNSYTVTCIIPVTLDIDVYRYFDIKCHSCQWISKLNQSILLIQFSSDKNPKILQHIVYCGLLSFFISWVRVVILVKQN